MILTSKGALSLGGVKDSTTLNETLVPLQKGLWREDGTECFRTLISEECFPNVFRHYAHTWYVPITW